MSELISSPETNRDATDARKPFEAPVVESMGHLKSLTLLQGVTLEP